MVDLSSAVVSTMTGMTGVVIGAIISNYVNQKIARQAAKKDIVFKKKIEYFEKIVNSIGKNIKLYRNAIRQLETKKNKSEIKKVLKTLKENRQKFEMTTSPLYMDTRVISSEIKKFVEIEKMIFKCMEIMNSENNFPQDALRKMKLKFKEIQIIGNKLTLILRKKLIEE
jgi:hypothetical protein